MTVVEDTKNSNLKLCKNCNGRNWLIECFCGLCNEIITMKDKRGRSRRMLKGHILKDKKGDKHYQWSGGRRPTSSNYILLWMPEHPFATKEGYVLEHRFVMEQFLGRYLKEEESIHHINKIKWDNRIENLMLFPTQAEHTRYEKKIDMSNRICLICKSHKTTNNCKGNPNWYNYEDRFICFSCYYKLYLKRKNK